MKINWKSMKIKWKSMNSLWKPMEVHEIEWKLMNIWWESMKLNATYWKKREDESGWQGAGGGRNQWQAEAWELRRRPGAALALLGSTSQLPMAILALLHLHCRILHLNRSLIPQMLIFSYEPGGGEYCQCWQYASFFFMKTEPTINEKNPPLLL